MSIKINGRDYMTDDPALAARASQLVEAFERGAEYTWCNGAWVKTRGNPDSPPVICPGPRGLKSRLVEFLGRFHWFRRIVGFE